MNSISRADSQAGFKQARFEPQTRTGFESQTGFGSQAVFKSKTVSESKTGSESRTGSESPVGFESQVGFEPQAVFKPQTGFNSRTGYGTQTGSESKTRSESQVEFESQAGLREERSNEWTPSRLLSILLALALLLVVFIAAGELPPDGEGISVSAIGGFLLFWGLGGLITITLLAASDRKG